MSNNITTLILNLLISESRIHRVRIADKVTEIIESNVGEFGRIEQLMRKQFIAALNACIDNPTGENKEFLFEIAAFYKDFYLETTPEVLHAAA